MSPRILRRPFPVAALAGVLLVGCRGEPGPDDVPIDVEVQVAPTPPIVGPARLLLSIRDSVGAPVEGAEVFVEGTMDHPGMVPVGETASDEGEGRYVVPAFDFDMAGDWVLVVRIGLPDGREAVRERRLRVVSGPAPGSEP